MEKKEIKRYFLIYEYKNCGFLHLLNFEKNEEGKYVIGPDSIIKRGEKLEGKRYTLAEIDEFTNSFDSIEDFYSAVIPSIPYEYQNDDDIFVLYNYKGIHSLNTHFGNKELKEKSLLVKNSKIDDNFEISSLTRLLCKNERFSSFLFGNLDSFCLYDDSLIDDVKRINHERSFCDYSLDDYIYVDSLTKIVRKKLESYKNFREVFLAKQSYFKMLDAKKAKVKKI